jgi:hypothetical protein
MGRLDELDLTRKLNRRDQDERLAAGGRRLAELRRFQRREKDPLRRWKITDEDWRNRVKRPQYVEAVDDMVARTDTLEAPWILVEAESKGFVKVMQPVIEQIERGAAARGFAVFEPLHRETNV